MPIGAIIGAGASLLGGVLSSKSQNKGIDKAADTSLQVANQNNALALDIYGQNKATLAPYVGAGTQPNALLPGAMGVGDTTGYRNAFKSFIDNSDYAFQFGEGANRVNSGYAGAGVLQSGAAMKGMEDYRQNLQQGYRGEFNNLLTGQQAVGLGAASAQAGVSQNFVNTTSQNNNLAGTAAANAALAKGANNPWANALGTVGGFALGRY